MKNEWTERIEELEAENKRLREAAELLLPIAKLYAFHHPYCELTGSGMSIYKEHLTQAEQALKGFIANQQPLGDDFQAVLDEHREELYVEEASQMKDINKQKGDR